MNIPHAEIEAVADALRRAQERCQPIAPVRERLADAQALPTAYAVQRINTERRLADGERIVGRKIGLTSKAVQAQLGVDSPDFGTLFAAMAVGDGETVPHGVLIQPKVEAELALVLAQDLPHERHTIADIVNATAYALAAIEIVDSRIADWNIRLVDTIADNASSGMFVLGTRPVPLSALDLAACRMVMTEDEREVSRGNGAACLGNPLNAAVWLADTMVRMDSPLRTGDVILTGALGPMAVVRPGASYRADIEGLGSVRVSFASQEEMKS